MTDAILIQGGIPVGFWSPSHAAYAKFAMEKYGGILGERTNFEVIKELEK